MHSSVKLIVLGTLWMFCRMAGVDGLCVSGSALRIDDEWVFVDSQVEEACGTGILCDSQEGWNTIDVWAGDKCDSRDQYFAAGYVEGMLSQDLVWSFYSNIKDMWFPNGTVLPLVADFLLKNEKWVQAESQRQYNQSYWRQVARIGWQRDGLLQGYIDAVAGTGHSIPTTNLRALVAAADLMDILSAKYPHDYDRMSLRDTLNLSYRSPHCSALLRYSGEDLLLGHATWYIYAAMVRLVKTYHYSTDQATGPELIIRTTSYPMTLSSNDDFYLSSTGLTITETTFTVFKQALFDLVRPECVLSWQRGLAATHLATTAPQWVEIYLREASGTQNNQWIVVDYNLVKLSESGLVPNTVWIAETRPGLAHSQEISSILNAKGFFGSFNIPMNTTIYNDLGYAEQMAAHGPEMYSYTGNVRAKIFDRESPLVEDVSGFQALMRWNHYKDDPASESNPEYAIDSRLDLTGAGPFGCVDAKVVGRLSFIGSGKAAHEENAAGFLSFLCQSGPTHDSLPPFDWSSYPKWAHAEIPDVVQFEWINSTMSV